MLRRDGALDSQDKSGFVVAPVTSAGRRPASEIYERAGLVESTTRRNAEEPNSRECRVPSVERPPAPPHCSRGWRCKTATFALSRASAPAGNADLW